MNDITIGLTGTLEPELAILRTAPRSNPRRCGDENKADVEKYCVLVYQYRDAANFKANGEVLLIGSCSEAMTDVIQRQCDMGQSFVAEQVGIPTLYSELYQFSDGPTADDLAFHEFECLRPATPHDLAAIKPWGTLDVLIARFGAGKPWDCRLSPHGY